MIHLTVARSSGTLTCEKADGNLLRGVWLLALMLVPETTMAEDLVRIGLFNRDAAIIAAQSRAFRKQENIRGEINSVTDSPTLLHNLIKGNYDLILNNADNVIAWADGQGDIGR